MSADTRTRSFHSLLQGTARRCGLDPSSLANTEAAALAEYLTVAAREAWRHYDWPDTIRIEERALRPVFSLAATYALGDIVYDEEVALYYEAIEDGFSGYPTDDASYWAVPEPFERSVTLLAPGDTPIGEVFSVWTKDPALDNGAVPVGFYLTESAVQFPLDAPNTVWLRFRLPPPRFTTTAWAAGTAYLAGELVYLAPHCWLALEASTGSPQGPATAPARWRVQELPDLFEDAVKRRAKAEWLSADGQDEKAAQAEALSREDLDQATQTLSDQQGQQRRYAVASRTSSRRQFQPTRLAV